MLDFNLWGLILICLKLMVASAVIGATIFIVILIFVFIWSTLKDAVNHIK